MGIIVLFFGSCSDQGTVNWKPTFDANGKEPFGTYLVYNSLEYYYPKAKIQKVNSNYSFSNLSSDYTQDDKIQALIIIGLSIDFEDQEIYGLMNFLEAGNVAIVSAQRLSPNFYNNFFAGLTEDYSAKGNIDLSIMQKEGSVQKYQYAAPETSSKVVLDSLNDKAFVGHYANEPNLASIRVGDGQLIIHGAPYSFTNYFMLSENKKYYETLMGFLPSENIDKIIFSSHLNHNSSESSFRVLMKYPPLKWAIYLTVFLALVYVFFEMKRRQRIVPIIPAPENNTAKFVQTMGRLYYNHSNHTNLAQKKILYFLEFVRIHYYLNTEILDDEFVQKLGIKSNQPITVVEDLVQQIKYIQSGEKADETFLIHLDQQIKLFTNGR